MTARALRLVDAASMVREERERSILALMPPGLPLDRADAWRWFASLYADDPPGWLPSGRYGVIIDELCAERALIAGYRSSLKTAAHYVYREPVGETERAKVNPYVPLLDAALKRELRLLALLGMSPGSPRKIF